MRYILTILLSFSLLTANARHITINNLFIMSTTIQVDSSLIGGDSIWLTGTIGNCLIQNLTGNFFLRLYVDASRALMPAFGGTVNFNNCNYVYAFGFNATDSINGRFVKIDGQCNDFTLDGRGVTLGNCGDYMFDLGSSNPTATYNGTPSTYRKISG